jgi:hypothetical protein
MKLRATALLFALFCLLITSTAWAQSTCDGVAGNLVANCGFETGDYTSWTQGGNLGFTSVTGNPLYVNSGNFASAMGPVGGDGTLEQFVGAPGVTLYDASFFLSNDGGSPNDFTVFWNGVDVGLDLVDYNGFTYTQFSAVLSGNAGVGANDLVFVFRHDPAFWALDDVVVTAANSPVPEPGSLILLGSGILGLAGVARRKLNL